MEELELRERLEGVLSNLSTSLDYSWGENPMVVVDNKSEVVDELVKLFFEGFNRAHEVGMEVGMYKAFRE